MRIIQSLDLFCFLYTKPVFLKGHAAAAAAAAAAKSCQSCPTLCNPIDGTAQQAPLFLGFSRQQYWCGLPFPSPMHESEN